MLILGILLLALIVVFGINAIREERKQDRTYLWKPTDDSNIDKKVIIGSELPPLARGAEVGASCCFV